MPTAARRWPALVAAAVVSNIGLVNELALMCDRMGINVWEVIDAAATKPFGFTALSAMLLKGSGEALAGRACSPRRKPKRAPVSAEQRSYLVPALLTR